MSAIWHRYTFANTTLMNAFVYKTADVNQWVKAGADTYQIVAVSSSGVGSFAQLGGAAGTVPNTRQIIAGTGLTGGGTLAADRTLTVAYGTGAGTSAQGNDSRLSDSRAPSGAAGGDLGGTYPNPTVTAIHETAGPTQLVLGVVTDGQLLKRSGTGLVGTTLFSAAGAWFPDVANPTPHADDQEFNGSWPPTGWAEWDVNSLITESQSDGFLNVVNSSNATAQIRGVYRACPPEAEWSIWVKTNVLAVQQTITSRVSCGVFLAEDVLNNPTTAKVAICWMSNYVSGGSYGYAAESGTWANYLMSGGALIGSPGYEVFNPAGGYVRLGYDGTNFSAYYAPEGLSWSLLGTGAKTFTPVYSGIAFKNHTGATAYHNIDFYRVMTGTNSSKLNAGLFRGARL